MGWQKNHQLGSWSRWQLIFLSVSLSWIIGAVDYAVRLDLSLSIFYLVPIAIAARYINRAAGLWVSVFCSMAWLWADTSVSNYTHPFLPIWNSGIRLVFFVLVSHLISLQQQALKREQQLARRDFLTGIHNRRSFLEILQLEMARSRRYFTPFTLAYLDLDNFKSINDQPGHPEGDRLLKSVTFQLKAILRETDSVGRLGGDEFAILFPNIDPSQAYVTLMRLHALLQSEIGSQWPVGFSMGAITFLKSPVSVEDAIAQADQIMYDIKHQGKNALSVQVVPANPSIRHAKNSLELFT